MSRSTRQGCGSVGHLIRDCPDKTATVSVRTAPHELIEKESEQLLAQCRLRKEENLMEDGESTVNTVTSQGQVDDAIGFPLRPWQTRECSPR